MTQYIFITTPQVGQYFDKIQKLWTELNPNTTQIISYNTDTDILTKITDISPQPTVIFAPICYKFLEPLPFYVVGIGIPPLKPTDFTHMIPQLLHFNTF